MPSGLGLVRVVSFDPTRRISKHDLSTLKLTGEHLSSKLLQYGQLMGLKPQETENGESPSTGKILLIHSNRLIRRRFSRTLANAYQIIEADNSSKALEVLSEQTTDLILLDHELPGTSYQSIMQTSERVR